MDSKVATFAATPDPTYGQRTPQKARPDSTGTSPAAPPSQDPADMRLVIEEDKASNSYVYKTVDRLTGKVIQQLPREQVLQLREQLEYEAGSVVKTKA
ncbi:flagellar protein FlaG [Phenylobacterium sp.]|jgi:flagellar protein FlaG|uniref:flagellar protein FlaG n=1 Tax=Phenylobacterium sp. TaxID=1871053 RepID=UPI002F403D81